MPTQGMSLLLDLYDCQSSALSNQALLEELFIGALQFAGLEPMDHTTRSLPSKGFAQIHVMSQAHATLYCWASIKFISIDIYTMGSFETVRPALELIRGYLTQKLIARSMNAQLIERGK